MVTLRALNSQSISSSSIYLPIQKNSELEHRIAVLRIWYVYPGIPDPNFSIPDPGSKVKNTVFLIRVCTKVTCTQCVAVLVHGLVAGLLRPRLSF